ncbi:Lipase [Lachnellula willkommii]|uniref:Lipase n=1 Tax=Lachnellula willkommii TaxID=215461 RepID=A0A559M4G1_9HELO|nr:Lipase [Lachnellula willkommii]
MPAVSTALLEHPDYRIVVTGHSLGAAVGTLAAVDLRSWKDSVVDLYTYGSPRVGNQAFADFVTSQAPAQGSNFRMTHENDPVPQLPPTLVGYQHTSPEYWLSGGDALKDDYSSQDVVVCYGVGNEACNAGTGLVPINGEAHDHYLGLIAACQGQSSF